MINNETEYYKDINLDFKPHPLTGDITYLGNEKAVSRTLRHITEMSPYDSPFNADLHSHLRKTLFELPSEVTKSVMEEKLKWAFNTIEPRAKIHKISIQLNQDETKYEIQVDYSVKSLIENYSTKFYIERLR